jgi:hypothetical protein
MGLDMFLTIKSDNGNFEGAYWRKANQIHDWFVQNVQGGVDECDEYPVTPGELMSLVETCQKVLANRDLAEELLPTTSGFFFGSTDYDEYYFEDLENTIEQITTALDNHTDSGTQFYYQASW